MKALKNIVIVGAGYAGVLTAKKLAKRLKKQENVQITVIDKNPFHTMYTELHEGAAHRVDEDSIKKMCIRDSLRAVGHHDRRCARIPPELETEPSGAVGRRRVERGEGFVHQQQARLHEQRARQRRPLRLPAA